MKTDMEITIIQKTLYGRIVFYPACETAELFAQLTETRTLTQEALKIIKDLGYTIKVLTEEVDIETL